MTVKKFNRTLTFDYGHSGRAGRQSGSGHGTLDAGSLAASTNNSEMQPARRQQPMDPLGGEVSKDLVVGLSGVFIPIQNDFSTLPTCNKCAGEIASDCSDRYRDEPHWPPEAREKVKRVRFVICLLALFGLALGLMSRLMLNVSIVEMVKKDPEVVTDGYSYSDATTPHPVLDLEPTDSNISSWSTDELLAAAGYGSNQMVDNGEISTETYQEPIESSSTAAPQANPVGTEDQEDDLHFLWSKQDVNMVLGAFYIGYAPGILFSGGFAEKYGAKYPMFICIFGSAVINILTPLIARSSLNLLIASRVMLGIIQGSLLPCLYELFNRWLTQTESSIFAPMIKVSMPLGSLIGTLMPGILASLKLEWPVLFYLGGLMCLAWSAAWVFLASSFPQNNRFVEMGELNRIMRKKKNNFGQPATITEKISHSSASPMPTQPPTGGVAKSIRSSRDKSSGTPWLLIATSPSVLALTTVKFTYNIGMDFIYLQLAVYLREVHGAPIETISVIASSGYCMQMLLITFVGWIAKTVIVKRTCGLSVTKWRKVFQGSSNFVMALTYVVLAYSKPNLEITALLLMVVCFWWMMGAGGESMLPYDLSSEYPASIVGFAHSFSIFSGTALAALCDVILGEQTSDPQRWSSLFYVLAGLLAGGGLVFVAVVKAKPFLPGEKVPRATRRALKHPTQQTKPISDQMGPNKLRDLK